MVRAGGRRHVRRWLHLLPPREGRFRVGPLTRRGVSALAAFAALSLVVATGILRPLDAAILAQVQRPASAALDLVGSVLTLLGQSEIAIGLAAGLAVARLRARRADCWVPLAILLTIAIEAVLKLRLAQPLPPPEVHRGASLGTFVAATFPYSFPSGHVARVAFLLAAARGVPVWIAAIALALVAVSRVYLGEHWPTDVVGGALLGLAVAWLVTASIRLWSDRRRSAGPTLTA